MRIEMEFEGLEELVKAFEKAASDDAIKETNKKIVERAQPVVKRIMSGKMPMPCNSLTECCVGFDLCSPEPFR